ncbi:MAG: hypothetical protein WCH05_10280 [Chlorobiaceae bacterium]
MQLRRTDGLRRAYYWRRKGGRLAEEPQTEEMAMEDYMKTSMPLTDFLERFRLEIGWDDEIELNEAEGRGILFSNLEINRQTYRAFVDGHVKRNALSLFLYPQFNVMDGKYVDACMLFNFLNEYHQYHGRISVDDNGKIRYKEFISVDNLEPETDMVLNMLDWAVAFFRNNGEAIAAVALTPKTYESIRRDYDKKDDASSALEYPDQLGFAQKHLPKNE